MLDMYQDGLSSCGHLSWLQELTSDFISLNFILLLSSRSLPRHADESWIIFWCLHQTGESRKSSARNVTVIFQKKTCFCSYCEKIWFWRFVLDYSNENVRYKARFPFLHAKYNLCFLWDIDVKYDPAISLWDFQRRRVKLGKLNVGRCPSGNADIKIHFITLINTHTALISANQCVVLLFCLNFHFHCSHMNILIILENDRIVDGRLFFLSDAGLCDFSAVVLVTS